jgi:M6 family metalloprotease-like protein
MSFDKYCFHRLFWIVLSFLLILSNNSFAIIPPPTGSFPKTFLQQLQQDSTLFRYDDSGWAKKMKRRKIILSQQARRMPALQAMPNLPANTFYLPVILANYSDNAGQSTPQQFDDLFFGNHPTGSMADYYKEISYSQFILTGDVYGWFTVDYSQQEYVGENYGYGSEFPWNVKGFFRDAVLKADPSVDFSRYDNDGPDERPNSGDDDGYVDAAIVIHPGGGAETGDEDNLWSAGIDLWYDNEYTTNDPSANGGNIKIKRGILIPELSGDGSETTINPIGVPCHEFGHVLGLPDLYDRTDESGRVGWTSDSHGIGNWGLMSYGLYGGDGNHYDNPTHMTAWCKIELGWVVPIDLVDDGSIVISQVETEPQVYRIWEDEYLLSRYFLIENRQKVGFDKYLPGSGLLIYHVDDNKWFGPIYSIGDVNYLQNNDKNHKLVDLEEADGNNDLDHYTNPGDAGDPFPGTSYNTSFGDNTNPNSKDYEGRSTGIEINDISNSSPIMNANIIVKPTQGYSIFYDRYGISGWQTESSTWGGVLFTAQDSGIIAAIDIGFFNVSTDYEIKIYDSINGLSPGQLLSSVNGHQEYRGWATIPISDQVQIGQNQDFFVAIRTSQGTNYDVFSELSGRSYYSYDGIDFYPYSSSVNFNIRARIKTPVGAVSPEITLSTTSISIGDVPVGSSGTGAFAITNDGNADLIVSNIAIDNSAFTVDPTSVTIETGQNQTVTVTFRPTISGIQNTTIRVISNDSDEDTLSVAASGTGITLSVFHSSTANETFKETTGSYEVWVKLYDVLSDPAVNVIISEDGGASFPDTVACNIVDEKFVSSLPARPLGTLLNYYFEVSDQAGNLWYFPPDAPSKSYTLHVSLHKIGDLNDDWRVNVFDLLELLKQLGGSAEQNSYGDVNMDDKVNIFDLLELLKMLSGS